MSPRPSGTIHRSHTEVRFDVHRARGRHKFAATIKTVATDTQGRRVGANGIRWKGL